MLFVSFANFFLFFSYIVLFLPLHTSSIQRQSPEVNLWIIARLRHLEWRKQCLSLDRCSEPRFQLICSLQSESNVYRTDSPVIIEGSLTREIGLYLYFDKGRSENVLIKGQIIGIDPLYKIPAECDKTNEVFAFKRINNTITLTTKTSSTSVIEIQGRCFTATVEVIKYQNICPWCFDDEVSIEESDSVQANKTTLLKKLSLETETFVLFVVAILVITIGCMICLLFLIVKFRKRLMDGVEENENTVNSINTPVNTLRNQPSKYIISKEESPYETIEVNCGDGRQQQGDKNYNHYYMTNKRLPYVSKTSDHNYNTIFTYSSSRGIYGRSLPPIEEINSSFI
uniref:Recep_L_domain domain-containing protein n=1 Tax=Rhabditophanes sp. KR3021 TaxID=114890 RepID=A0AC35U7U9_9BILA